MKLSQKYSIVRDIIRQKDWNGALNLLQNLLSLTTEPMYVRSNPMFIQIEPTIRCNLRCKMCINPHIKSEKLDLSVDDFKMILDKIPYLKKISFVGRGEPLLNPYFFKLIQLAKEREISVGFATNGMMLNKEISSRLVDLKIDWINISVDGVNKYTFEDIRRGADFDKVVENIKILKRLSKNSNKPETSIWFLAIRSNFKELPAMVNLCKKIGIKSLNVQAAHYWGDETWQKSVTDEFLKDVKNTAQVVFAEAFKKAKIHHINLNFHNIPDKNSKRGCKWPWYTCYISVDGYITPCCMNGSNPNIINFGNILSDEFSSIWNGEEYKKFRRALKGENPLPICRDCTAYHKNMKIL